jgi:hypothetical protein
VIVLPAGLCLTKSVRASAGAGSFKWVPKKKPGSMDGDNVLDAAKNKEWDKLKVHLSSIASRTAMPAC